MPFLCVGTVSPEADEPMKRKPKSTTSTTSRNIQAGVVCVQVESATQTTVGSTAILPTFTALIGGHIARIVKDSNSRLN